MSKTTGLRNLEGMNSSSVLFLKNLIVGAEEVDGETLKTRNIASLKSGVFWVAGGMTVKEN